MEPVSDGVIAVIGVKLGTVISGAAGSFISLRFFDGLTTVEKWSTFFGGWGLAAFLAGPLTLYLELRVGMETGLSLMIGLFGMSVAAALIRVLRDTDWAGIIKGRFGSKPPNSGDDNPLGGGK